MFLLHSFDQYLYSPHSINQNDSCDLERDLYSRFYHESQVQSFHLVRSLGALAEWYGRTGEVDKAFKYFNTMTSIYMPQEHAPLICQNYAVNRCAITYAVSALWYLQKGQPKQAIQRCDQVINEILPTYDKKDMIGLYHIFWCIIRVLKWHGEVDKAREFYDEWTPDGIENHFAVGSLHKPMVLLLKICDGNPDGEYETEDMNYDIDMVLEFDAPDMTDLNFITDGCVLLSEHLFMLCISPEHLSHPLVTLFSQLVSEVDGSRALPPSRPTSQTR